MVCPKAVNLSQMGSLLSSPLIAAGNHTCLTRSLALPGHSIDWIVHCCGPVVCVLASAQVKSEYRGPERRPGWATYLTPHQRSYNNISPVLSACLSLFQVLPILRFGLVGLLLLCAVWDASHPHIPSCSFGCITNEMLKSNPLTGDSSPCFLWDLACQFVLGPVPLQQLCICHMSERALVLPVQQKPTPASNQKAMRVINGRHLLQLHRPLARKCFPKKVFCLVKAGHLTVPPISLCCVWPAPDISHVEKAADSACCMPLRSSKLQGLGLVKDASIFQKLLCMELHYILLSECLRCCCNCMQTLKLQKLLHTS